MLTFLSVVVPYNICRSKLSNICYTENKFQRGVDTLIVGVFLNVFINAASMFTAYFFFGITIVSSVFSILLGLITFLFFVNKKGILKARSRTVSKQTQNYSDSFYSDESYDTYHQNGMDNYMNENIYKIDDPLTLAAGDGDIARVRQLISEGADVHARDQQGNTPLMAAAINGHKPVIQLLLDSGADINMTNYSGWDALCFATMDHAQIVDFLLKNGSNPNRKVENGMPVFFQSIYNGNISQLKAFISAGADLTLVNDEQWTGLMSASRHGHFEMVKLLLKGNVSINAQNIFGETALIWASIGGYNDIVHELINAKADIKITDRKGMNAAFWAVYYGFTDTSKILIDTGANINLHETENGATPLIIAVSQGNLTMVRILIDAGADKNAKDNRGVTPKFIAREKGFHEMLNLL